MRTKGSPCILVAVVLFFTVCNGAAVLLGQDVLHIVTLKTDHLSQRITSERTSGILGISRVSQPGPSIIRRPFIENNTHIIETRYSRTSVPVFLLKKAIS